MILDLGDMIAMARDGGFALPVFDVAGVALARAAVAAAAQMDSPVVLRPVRDEELLMPSLVALAKRAPVPVAPILGPMAGAEAAAVAIRLGAQGVVTDGPADADTAALAAACAVALIPMPARKLRDGEKPQPGLAWFGDILDGASGPVVDKVLQSPHSVPWSELVELAAKSARGNAAQCIGRCASSSRIADLAAQCRTRREVSHVVLYNPEGADEAALAATVAEGVQTLSKIPGVRRVFAGKAVTPGARYGHAWVVRFAARGVIDLYRDHPDHKAFADELFRPIAADRMTIDFMDDES